MVNNGRDDEMNCSISDFFTKCLSLGGTISLLIGRVMMASIAILFGVLIARNPEKAVEIQEAIYRPLNLKTGPSMVNAVKSTRVMGIVVIILGIILFIYSFLK